MASDLGSVHHLNRKPTDVSQPPNRPPIRPSVPRRRDHNTGPLKRDRAYRAGRVPDGVRRCGRVIRPVVGYVVCIVLGALVAIGAGVTVLYIMAAARH